MTFFISCCSDISIAIGVILGCRRYPNILISLAGYLCGENKECPKCVGDIIHAGEDDTLKNQLRDCYDNANGLCFFFYQMYMESDGCNNDNNDNNNIYNDNDKLTVYLLHSNGSYPRRCMAIHFS